MNNVHRRVERVPLNRGISAQEFVLLKLSETAANRNCGKILDTTMPEFADRGLVRYRLGAKVDADEPAHRPRVVQRLCHRPIRQIEPVLQKMNPEHPFHPDQQLRGAFAFRIKWLEVS